MAYRRRQGQGLGRDWKTTSFKEENNNETSSSSSTTPTSPSLVTKAIRASSSYKDSSLSSAYYPSLSSPVSPSPVSPSVIKVLSLSLECVFKLFALLLITWPFCVYYCYVCMIFVYVFVFRIHLHIRLLHQNKDFGGFLLVKRKGLSMIMMEVGELNRLELHYLSQPLPGLR